MSIELADIVQSTQGRDRGGSFFVLRCDGEYAWIVNGRDRRIEKAKKKKLKHIRKLELDGGRVAAKLRSGDRVTNSEIRRALSLGPDSSEGQGGMHIGEGRRDRA